MLSFGKIFQKSLTTCSIRAAVARLNSSSSSAAAVACESWELHAKPFSKLNVNLENCHVKVTTADPVDFENKMLISLFRAGQSSSPPPSISNTGDVVNIQHTQSGDRIEIATPVAVDVSVDAAGSASVNLSSIEAETVKVVSEAGEIFLKSIKSTTITCESDSGDILTERSLQGNVSFTTGGDGRIQTGRIQGLTIDLTTESGYIHGGDIYAEELISNTCEGDIVFKSVHGVSEINSEEGDIFVGVANGQASISAEDGALDVFVSDHSDIFMNTNGGDVRVYSGVDNGAKVFLEASSIELDDNLGADQVKERKVGAGLNLIADIYGGGPPIVVKAGSGKTSVAGMSWVERIGVYQKRKSQL